MYCNQINVCRILNTIVIFQFFNPMDYEKFVEEIRKMLSEYPEKKMFVPTLGGRSLFLVCVQEGKLKIVNSRCKSYLFSANEYEAIKYRFETSPAFVAFKTCNYTRTTGKARCIGWCAENGNRNEIYWGYLPAVFRELYARKKVCVGKRENYQSADVKNYRPVDWVKFIPFIDVGEIINVLSSTEFNLKPANQIVAFSSAKNFVSDWLKSSDIYSFLFSIWEGVVPIIADEIIRSIVILILKKIRKKIKERLKKLLNKNGRNQYPHRDCKNCPQSNNLKTN